MIIKNNLLLHHFFQELVKKDFNVQLNTMISLLNFPDFKTTAKTLSGRQNSPILQFPVFSTPSERLKPTFTFTNKALSERLRK